MKRCVIPISGGMDSTVILHYAKKMQAFDEIYALTFFYGQRHWLEIACAKSQCEIVEVTSHKNINLNFFSDIVTSSSLTNKAIDVAKTKDAQGHPQTVNYVPFRNLMMLSIACAHAESVGADTVFHGATQLDTLAGFWDGSPEFLCHMNQMTALNRKSRIKVEAPLINMTKAEIIQLGNAMRVDFSLTHTCYDPQYVYESVDNYEDLPTVKETLACGECTACGGRLKGFIDAGIKDPKPYAKEILWEKYSINR